jgi:response regulator RpfG family c-di-GMP phosphodiesterase
LALKLLIVDPSEEWLESAKQYFDDCLYETKIVANGKDAQVAVYKEKYFAIILNVATVNHSGIQVLKFIRAKYPLLKVLMITEIDESVDEEDQWGEVRLKKMGATEVITRPFEFNDLKGLLEGHQSINEMISIVPKRKGLSPEEEVDGEDNLFTSVKISEFYTAAPVLFDLFIKLKSGRYIKILHAGDTFSKERVDKYKNEKNVEHLYFEKKDLFKYVKFTNYFAEKIMTNKKVATKVKMRLVQNVAEKFLEQSFSEGMKPQIIEQGKEIAENIYTMIQENEDLYQVFRDYSDFDPSIFTHAYLTTIFSTAIIKQYEWQSKITIECTAFACMFHDIGKMKLDPALLTKKRVDMTEEEFEEYKKHPEYGLDIIEGKPMINNSIKQIIYQHHEHYDGTGFPLGIKGSKILTLSNIVRLADEFVHIIQEQDLKPIDALKVLLQNRADMIWYNSTIVENLIKVFVAPEKIMKENHIPSNSRMVPNKKAS